MKRENAMNINRAITELIDYAVDCGLVDSLDRAYVTGRILHLFALDDYAPDHREERRPLCQILDDLLDYAVEAGLIECDSVVYRDLFDTEIMGVLVDRPSCVISKFEELYKTSPEAATDYFYKLACDSN